MPVQLKDICVPDGIQTGPFGSQLKAEEYIPCGVPVVMPQDIANGRIVLDHIARISQDKANSLQKHRFELGDIVFSRRGDVAKIAIISETEAGFICGTGCLRARPRADQDPNLLRILIETPAVRKWLEQNAVGQTMPNLNTQIVGALPLLIPPADKHELLERISWLWGAAVDAQCRVVSLKRHVAIWTTKQLLSRKRRLPGFLKNWDKVCIGDFLTESRITGSHGAKARKITLKLYGRGMQGKDDRRSGSENTKYYIRRAGQFIYSKLDFLNGAFGIIPEHLDGYETTLDLPCFDVAEGLDARFLLLLVSREEFYSRFLGSAAGGRKARRVNPAEFLATKIHIPGINEQRAIVDAVATLDREIDLLERQLAALKRQKQALMQQLLTGRIRVGEAREPVQRKTRRTASA